jgi:hypothetical protein
MTPLTLFSAPKPFTDPHIALIHRNAIQTWVRLPDTIVILIGNEPGLAQAAAEFGIRHFPDVACNAEGTPLISSIFEIARRNSDSPLLAYVNGDIALLPDFVERGCRVAGLEKRFLLVGRRWDVDITEPIDFSPGWQTRLEHLAHEKGHLHKPAGSDYFIFPRACFTDIPDFAVGRAGWDNWMIFKARKDGWKTIDATPSITIIHQNHDYSHLPGGQIHHRHPESLENRRMAGGKPITHFTLNDATHVLKAEHLERRPWTPERLLRAVEIFPLLYLDNAQLTTSTTRTIRKIRRKLGMRK